MTSFSSRPPSEALSAWPKLASQPVRQMTGGLINQTFVVGSPPTAVLQCLHPIFPPEIHNDIEAITEHIEQQGVLTPRLIRTSEGALSITDSEGGCWRVLTYVEGTSVDRVDGPEVALQAGRIVGSWHQATATLEHEFHFSRPGAHDTAAHMATLEAALTKHTGHRLLAAIQPLADELQARWSRWDGPSDETLRICHGDLKISNVRFDRHGRARCLVDLDTMAMLPLSVELGDAARSWCNIDGEDCDNTRFDVSIFEAAMTGYLSQAPLSSAEREALPPGIERICLELSARFAADALNEIYFGWDQARFPRAGEHNLLRAAGQLSLARSVASKRSILDTALR